MQTSGISETPKQSNYDVVIVGGAMMGSSTAWFLSDNPDFNGSVLVVERDPSYEFASTSHTNSCIRQQFSAPLNIKISQFAAEFVKNARELMGDEDLEAVTSEFPEDALPVPELIDHIITKHHEFLRKTLLDMKIAAEIIAEDYDNIDENLDLLLFYLDQLTVEQFNHMQKEESILFPYIKSLYEEGDPLNKVCFGSIKSPLSVMEMEHDNCLLELEQIRRLANDYQAPEWAGPLLTRFYKDLESMEKDLIEHLEKENNILHPKAIAKEREIYS